jgi:hypothetical protein
VGGDVPVDSESLLVTDFVNLKIKSAQSFGGAHRDRMCMCVLIGVSNRMCMSIYICTVFLKTVIMHKDGMRENMQFLDCPYRNTHFAPTATARSRHHCVCLLLTCTE